MSPASPSTRRVLLIGASASFGPALLHGFAAQGAQVLATSRSGRLEALREAPAGAQLAALDLLDPAALDDFAGRVLPGFGRLDVAVFMAGILPGKALQAYDDALMAEVMNCNFTAQAALLRRLLPHFNAGAQIWMTASISGERGSFDPVYAASKAALIAFVKSLATWLAPQVRCNAIAPALIEHSPMYEAMAPERRAHHLRSTPTQHLTTPAEVAGVLLNLCEPAWANLNGQVIRLNGGAHV